MGALDRLGWAGTTTISVKGRFIGVRCNTAAGTRAIRDILSAHVAADVAAPANYSLLLQSDAGSRRSLQLLYRGCVRVGRFTHVSHLLEDFLRRLDEEVHEDRSVLRIDAAAFIFGEEAVLGPQWMGQSHRVRSRLRRHGALPTSGTMADLALDDGRLVVRAPSFCVDQESVRRWAGHLDGGRRPEPNGTPGSYPVAAWIFPAHVAGRVTNVSSTGAALLAAASLAQNASAVGGLRTLQTLAATIRGSAHGVVTGTGEDGASAFLDALRRR